MSKRNKFFHNFECNYWYLETYIDINKADCFVDYSKVDIGFTAENAVKAVRKNMSDKQLLDFRLSCRNFLKAVVAKLLNKTAVHYPLANNLAFLDPRLISDSEKNKTRLKFILRLSVQCNRVAESDVDEIMRQHSKYEASMTDKERDSFVNFDPVKPKVDILMHKTMTGKFMYSKL